METREYFESVMQGFNQNRNGRSLRKYCIDNGVDYRWLSVYKKSYIMSWKSVLIERNSDLVKALNSRIKIIK